RLPAPFLPIGLRAALPAMTAKHASDTTAGLPGVNVSVSDAIADRPDAGVFISDAITDRPGARRSVSDAIARRSTLQSTAVEIGGRRPGARLFSRLKLRHLTLLTRLGRLRSLTRAADSMGISQPAATKALAELEDIFEAPLFVRSRQGLEPTPLGKLAPVRAERMMLDLDHWGQEMESVRSGRAAQLRVGVIPFVSGRVLTPTLERLCAEGINVVLHRATTDRLLQEMRGHEVDCEIGRGPCRERGAAARA